MDHSINKQIQQITDWETFQQFAGKVVAYRKDPEIFGSVEDSCPLNSDGNLRFAYVDLAPEHVEKEDGSVETRYNVSRLRKSEDLPTNGIFITSQLSKPIFMRLAADHEVQAIQQAVDANRAKFESRDKEDVVAILRYQLIGAIFIRRWQF